MCIPPFCEPARGFLGCFSLRTGAAVALVLDFCYGLVLVILHALLIGEANDAHWFLQYMDMGLSWGHNLLGFDDSPCLLGGLLYGVLVIVSCVIAVNSLCGPKRPATSSNSLRWYLVTAHVQLVIYVAVSLAKYPALCKLQFTYYSHLGTDCDAMRFAFVERVVHNSCLGAACLWVLGSYAFFTSKGVADDEVEEEDPYSDEDGLRSSGGGGYHVRKAVATRTYTLPTGYAGVGGGNIQTYASQAGPSPMLMTGGLGGGFVAGASPPASGSNVALITPQIRGPVLAYE